MSSYRTSDANLAYGDDYDYPRPQRWDRNTFERYRQQYNRPEPERETRPRGSAPVRELDIEIDDKHRGPRRRGSDIDIRIREEVRPARRVDFLNEPDPDEIAAKALAPYRRRVSIAEREVEPRRVARPGFIRRQSSLDTFDRRPTPRYHDEYRIPANVNIPLPIRRRERERARDYEDVRIRERDHSSGTEYSEDIHIRRRKSRGRREPKVEKAPTVRESSSSSSATGSFEEIRKTEILEDDIKSVKSVRTTKSGKSERVVEEDRFEERIEEEEVQERGRKGKTRMPKRLAHKGAIVELGYAFEEEDDFYIVRRALGKEHIDEIIELSKTYKVQEMKRVYKYELEAEKEESVHDSPHDDEYIKTTTIIHEHDDKSTVRASSPTPTQRTYRTTTRAPTLIDEAIAQEELQESASIAGPLASLVPRRNDRRSEKDIRREIEELEIERRSLRQERDDDDRKSHRHRRGKSRHEERRETDYEFVERVDRRSRSLSSDRETKRDVREVIRVEKDRKGRMALVRSAR